MIPTQQKKRPSSNGKRINAPAARRNSKSKPDIKTAKFNKIAGELEIYRQMVESANHGFVITDMKGNLLYVNDSFARMHGYKAHELIGKNLKIFHNAKQLKHVRAVFKQMKKTGKGLNNEELWRVRRDGTVFPTVMNTWLMKDKNGRPIMECATAVDISESETSRKALEAMLNATNDLVAMIDRQCNVVEVNKKMADAFGHTREELIGRCAWNFHTPEIAAQRRTKVEHVMATGEAMTFVDSVEDGKIYSNSCYPLKDLDGKVTGMVVFAKDVTQQKKTEEELKIYKQMVDSSNHGHVFADIKGNLLYVNEAIAKMHGYKTDELIGKKIKIFYNAEQYKVTRLDIKDLVKKGKGIHNAERWHVRRDGTIFPTLMNSWPVKGKDGRPMVICATAADISSLRQREKDLETSKKTLEAMLNASGELIAMIDRDANIIDLNESMAKVLGRPKGKLIGRCVWDFMPPKVVAVRRLKLKQVMATGKPVTYLNEYGNKIYSSSYYPLKGPDGKVTGMVVFAKDVTQQKKAEEGLEASKKTLEAMLNATTDLVALMDRDLKYVDMNDKMAKGLRIPKEQLIGRYSLDLMEPEVAALRRAKAKEAMATGKPVTFEHTSHGRIFSATCYPVTGADGKINGIVVFAKDITQRKKAEANLEESKKTLEAMLNASGEAVAMLDRNLNFVEVNERMVDAFRIPREGLIGHSVWESMPPEAIALRRPKAEYILATGKPVTFLDEDKGRNYSISGYPLKASDGKVTGIVVFAKDVTEQIKAEADLEASYKTLETMLNASGDAVAMLDRGINFIEANERMAEAFGQPREKLIGKCAWDCMPAKAKVLRQPKAEHILTTGKPVMYFDEDDMGRVYSVSGYPLKDADGKVTGIVVFAKDVTQHKKAETELNHYREELFKLRRSASLDLFGSIIGHELSQPLTIINMLMEETAIELESGRFEKEKIIETLKTCLKETKTAGETIQKMRIQSRQWLEGRIEQFSPSDVIREITDSLELKAREAKIRIEVISPKALPTITGYRSAFEQMVLNIAENAIEAADGEKWHRLTINAEKTDRHIELTFCDDCRGIAKENLGKIFEPFYSTKTLRGGKNIGMGLSIVRRILTATGGDIQEKSIPGKGTIFYVNWPLS